MLNRIFPKTADNASYRGSVIAVWLLVPIAFMRALQGANSIWQPALVATGADGIPLDSYGHAAAGMIVLLFALLGLYLILMALIALVILIRYRALIPLAYLLFLASLLGTRAINALYPTGRAEGTPIGFYINMGLLAAMALGFILSLVGRTPHADG
jgi:hypothetical protein